jgi:zinc transporter 9
VEPFTPLIIGLLLFSLALELWTFRVALKEIGGWRGVRENRTNTTVLAVLLEDAVALLGILLTLVVAGISFVWGPRPIFDATVAILVGVLLGVMALFLATLNRKLLIDTSDPDVDSAAQDWLAARDISGVVNSLVLDDNMAVVFVKARHDVRDSFAVGEALKAQLAKDGKTVVAVYWKFAGNA